MLFNSFSFGYFLIVTYLLYWLIFNRTLRQGMCFCYRNSEIVWLQAEHKFQQALSGYTSFVMICQDQVIDSIIEIKECMVKNVEGAKIVYLKIKRKAGVKQPDDPFTLLTEIMLNGEKAYALMDCWRQYSFDPLDHYLYITPMRADVELLGIKGLYQSF